MPKYLDNYKLEIIANIYSDNSMNYFIKVEHYLAKQIDTDKKFILKRFKINPSHISTQAKSFNLSPHEQQLFDKLTNETLILKILEHKSIPKCLRMLKTSNSIYFLFQHYPLQRMKDFVQQNFISFDQKILLSAKIIETICYIHSQNVVYKAISLDNIYIDRKGDIFFTNFKNSIFFENLQTNQKSLQIIKKQRQFLALLKQDIIDLAKMLYQLLSFDQIDPKVYSFKNTLERKLYQYFSDILRKIVSPNILQTLQEILKEKQTQKIIVNTDEPQSPRSPCLSSIKTKKTHVRTNTSIESQFRSYKNSKTSFNTPVKDSVSPRGSLLQSQRTFVKQSSTTLNSSCSRLSSSTKFFSSKTKAQLTQRTSIQSIKASVQLECFNKQKYSKRKEAFQHIIKYRKLQQFLFHFLKQINLKSSSNLVILLLIKCEQLLIRIKQNILYLKSQQLTMKKQQQFFTIVDSQTLATEKYLAFIKESMLSLINSQSVNQKKYYQSIQQCCKKNKLFSLEDDLSDEIFTFIEEEIKNLTKLSPQIKISANRKNNTKSSKSTQVNAKKQEKINSAQHFSLLNSQNLYQKQKWLYFMSIKLKYGNFQKFYNKKIDLNSPQLSIFKQEYFLPFQSQSIPQDQIVDQIINRIDRYKKKCDPSLISVK